MMKRTFFFWGSHSNADKFLMEMGKWWRYTIYIYKSPQLNIYFVHLVQFFFDMSKGGRDFTFDFNCPK